jgi:hypothetical protein
VVRNTLELARESLFLEKINQTFPAAELLLDQGADSLAVAGALVVPLLWQGLAQPDEIQERLGRTIETAFGGLEPPFLPEWKTDRNHHQDIQALLKSFGGISPQGRSAHCPPFA